MPVPGGRFSRFISPTDRRRSPFSAPSSPDLSEAILAPKDAPGARARLRPARQTGDASSSPQVDIEMARCARCRSAWVQAVGK